MTTQTHKSRPYHHDPTIYLQCRHAVFDKAVSVLRLIGFDAACVAVGCQTRIEWQLCEQGGVAHSKQTIEAIRTKEFVIFAIGRLEIGHILYNTHNAPL